MAKPKDFSDDLAVLDASVKGEVDTILKLVREKEKEVPRPDTASDEGTVTPPFSSVEQVRSQERDHQEASPKKVRRNTARPTAPVLHEQAVLENVTTRLRRETNELLTDSALRQKLKKESPSTRQDIIEFALQDWFWKHGYRSSAPGDE
jgi:hypothetical protein